MKKLIIIFFVFFSIFHSCKSTRTNETKTTEIKSDSLIEKIEVKKLVEISKAIKDSSSTKMPDLKTGLGKDCDSTCNEKYQEALATINFYKKSGANSYKMFYDKETKYLHTIANMQQTISTQSDSISKIKKATNNDKQTIETVVKNKYPKWLVYLAICGGIAIVYRIWRIYLFFKPV